MHLIKHTIKQELPQTVVLGETQRAQNASIPLTAECNVESCANIKVITYLQRKTCQCKRLVYISVLGCYSPKRESCVHHVVKELWDKLAGLTLR